MTYYNFTISGKINTYSKEDAMAILELSTDEFIDVRIDVNDENESLTQVKK
jgi:hypothetical protein